MLLGVEHGLAIGNGILTVEDMAQAEVRADPEGMDKGGGAAAAALHLVALARRFRRGAITEDGETILLAGDPGTMRTA
jgi:6,7-dimethyl-8-ribityllumazine synthase